MSRSNVRYRNAVERSVSLADAQELASLVDEYLLVRNYTLTEVTRERIRELLVPFRAHPPMLRADLIHFLDTVIAPLK